MTNQSPNPPQEQRQQIGKILAVTITLFLIPLLLFLLATRPAHAQTAKSTGAKHYTDLTFPPLPDIKLPRYDRFQLKNGMVVYLMEDKELPLVSGSAIIRSGSKLDAGNQVGLSSIMATVMRSGGTKAHSGNTLDQILEQQAASIESSMGNSSGGASFSALSEDLPQVLSLLSEVLQQPAFPEDKINLAKFQIKGGIARRNDDPGEIMGREFRKLIYGETSPYARQVEYKTIANVTRQDLVDRYNATYRPENIILGIVGDIDSKTLKPQIEKLFGNWRNPNPPLKAKADQITQARTSGTFFVNQDQLNQSYIRMGHLGGRFDSPDYPALSVMNEVLSSFGGRLFNEIRSRQGLAYSVYAAWSPQFDIPGVFLSGGETRSEATVAFIRSMKQEIERIRSQPVSAAELQAAKDGVLNSFIFNFEDPAQTLSRLMRYEYFGYPSDFIFRYQKAVEKTTIADVQRVAKQYLQPDKLVTIVVGNQGLIKPGLTELGKVQAIDVSIPQP